MALTRVAIQLIPESSREAARACASTTTDTYMEFDVLSACYRALFTAVLRPVRRATAAGKPCNCSRATRQQGAK